MADIVFIALTFAFFALCVLYVRGCDRIIASADDDSTSADVTDVNSPNVEQAA